MAVNNGIYPPLVFFYSGHELPRYARVSLARVSKVWPGEVVLLADFATDLGPKVTVDYYPTWFLEEKYRLFGNRSSLDAAFRDGFWLKAALRFFVLEQWCIKTGIERLVHCELDVAILDSNAVSGLATALDRGIYVPRASKNLAVASSMIVIGQGSLTKMVDFFVENATLGNEMRLLSEFLNQKPELGLSLPTTSDLARRLDGSSVHQNPYTDDSGGILFDAAQVGHWLLGSDARNIPGELVRNHYEWEYGEDSIRIHRHLFHFLRWGDGHIKFVTPQGVYKLASIHCHSKSMRFAYSRAALRFFAMLARGDNSHVIPIRFVRVPFRMTECKRLLDIQLVRLNRLRKRAVSAVSSRRNHLTRKP